MAFFDSLDQRMDYIQQQIARLKLIRDVSYYNYQRELDLTTFVKAYEEYVSDEDLDKARELAETRLQRAEIRKDLYSIHFYREYLDDAFALIKKQHIFYQTLFVKEKCFKKEFERYIAPGNLESLQRTEKMVEHALKYARENNLTETLKYLEVYKGYTQAMIFDAQSAYNLAILTNNSKEFEKVFKPLLGQDSLQDFSKAEMLLEHCLNYGKLTGSSLGKEYFGQQVRFLSAAKAEKLERERRENELERYTDQAVTACFDTLNPPGIFQWHNQVIVIDEFVPTSGIENVKKGEAIMHADKMLSAFLVKNKLCSSVSSLTFGHTFIIPYKSDGESSTFFFNSITRKWQYIACYRVIVNPKYTLEVCKIMPPVRFKDEARNESQPL